MFDTAGKFSLGMSFLLAMPRFLVPFAIPSIEGTEKRIEKLEFCQVREIVSPGDFVFLIHSEI
jgi:hypothetical protein